MSFRSSAKCLKTINQVNVLVVDIVAADVRRLTYFPGDSRASSRRLLPNG
jgi:hypothetical protein